MSTPRFLQIHTLTEYPASLLNRDDAGLAKRIEFGGASRTRISSQCLKRHWRTVRDAYGLEAVGLEKSVRSRVTLNRRVVQPLVADGLNEGLVTAVVEQMVKGGLFHEAEGRQPRKRSGSREPEPFETGQVTVLGDPELTYLREAARTLATENTSEDAVRKATDAWLKAERQNLAALKNGAGLDAALFGRMVTSDILARKNAAVHVAHAFTVHAEASEPDYFSAVDDLVAEAGETGSGHIGETELTSGLFYGYVVVDVPQLVYNLEGLDDPADWLTAWQTMERGTAGQVVAHLLHLIAKVSPGAKLGSTAPYSRAQVVLAEAGDVQPRTLANAFSRPVQANGAGYTTAAGRALAGHVQDLDDMYGQEEQRWLASLGEGMAVPGAERMPFNDLVAAVRAVVAG